MYHANTVQMKARAAILNSEREQVSKQGKLSGIK